MLRKGLRTALGIHSPVSLGGGGLPVVISYLFDGSVTRVVCGSDASIDDLPTKNSYFTIDGYFKWTGAGDECLISKGTHSTTLGWVVRITAGTTFNFWSVWSDGVLSRSIAAPDQINWHHFIAFTDVMNKEIRLGLDGSVTAAVVSAGNYVSDASSGLAHGKIANLSSWFWTGNIAWMRFSSTDRFSIAGGGPYVVPPLCPTPSVDAGTIELWKYDEGAGLTAGASVNTPTNDGTITQGAGNWNTDDCP